MVDNGMGSFLASLLVLALVVVSFGVMFRPFRRLLFPRRAAGDGDRKKAGDARSTAQTAGEVALEVVALVSLALGFPTGALGLTSIVFLTGFAVGLAFMPHLTRPLIAVAMASVALSRLPATTLTNLAVVVGAFLLLKSSWFIARRLLGVGA